MEHYEGKPRIKRERGGYVVIGMQYGYWYTPMGSIKVWNTYSGAYSALTKFLGGK